MKKSLFYWVFLVLAGMGLTACSSGDDNIADNTTPVTPDSQNRKVILTGTIGVGGDETRAVDNAGVTSWEVGNVIAINYQKTNESYARTYCTITQVSSDKHFASFEATLEDPKNDGYIGFAYPNDKVTSNTTPNSAYNFGFNYSAYYNDQDGTTEGISNSRLDYACTESGGEVKMAVDGSTAKLKGNALLKNQFSMYKFTLVKEGETSTNVPATKLQIFIKSSGSFPTEANYTVKPANSEEYSVFYVALQPTESTVEGVKIVASFDGKDPAIKLDDATKVNAITSTDYGKLLSVDANDDDKQAYLCAKTTSPKYCEHIYGTSKFVKGKLYSADLTVKDLTPTAVIAYAGDVSNYCSKFIALALEDVYSGTKTLSDAQALIGTDDNWVVQHKMKIAGTTYSTLQGDNGKYDEVRDNTIDATTKVINSSYSSATSTSLRQGWRIPTVTDFRYIFQALGVMDSEKINATTPAGITDQDGHYYSGQEAFAYKTGTGMLYTSVNSLFSTAGVGTDIEGQYYWLGSKVISRAGDAQNGKAWRFSFSADQFEWNESNDQSLARLVFAY